MQCHTRTMPSETRCMAAGTCRNKFLEGSDHTRTFLLKQNNRSLHPSVTYWHSHHVNLLAVLGGSTYLFGASPLWRPCGLTFSWWGCYGSCLRHKPTERAHSFLFCSCVCFCLSSPLNCISFHKFSRQLCAFSLCSSGLISAL